jgi:hypothetical protein
MNELLFKMPTTTPTDYLELTTCGTTISVSATTSSTTAWTSSKHGSQQIVWNSFHTHRMNDIPINKSLQHNAMTSAKPFLDAKEPDFILATDIEYEEKKIFEMTTNDSDNATTDPDTGWTEVSSTKKTNANLHQVTAA